MFSTIPWMKNLRRQHMSIDVRRRSPYHDRAENHVIARVVNKAHSFDEAQEWDILQNIRMTPDERRAAAKELKRRAYGETCPDVRETRRTSVLRCPPAASTE